MSVPDPERFTTGGLSDVGQVRTVNQDSFDEFSDPAAGRRLWMVADGMGGHLGGEVASKMAVETVAEVFAQGGGDPGELLGIALETANRRVHQAALADQELSGMGTTGVCLLFEAGGRGWVGHVGDSRAYQLRAGKILQITEDHSVVGALIRMGHITEEEARQHPQRNEILRAIGTNDEVDVQVTPLQLRPGDTYLLCSDGLWEMVDDSEIAAVLDRETPEDAARILVEMANLEGGNDNITAQVVSIPGEPESLQTTEMFQRTDALPGRRLPIWLWVVGVALLGALAWLLLAG